MTVNEFSGGVEIGANRTGKLLKTGVNHSHGPFPTFAISPRRVDLGDLRRSQPALVNRQFVDIAKEPIRRIEYRSPEPTDGVGSAEIKNHRGRHQANQDAVDIKPQIISGMNHRHMMPKQVADAGNSIIV